MNCTRNAAGPCWRRPATVFLGVVLAAGAAWAQDDVPLYEGEPFDQITLTQQYNSEVYRIFPLDMTPQEAAATHDPERTIRIRLFTHPDREFDVAWKDIARYETFDQVILRAAHEFVSAGKFDEAYHHIAYLLRENPAVPQLQATIDRFLLNDAFSSFKRGDLHEALALLEEVHQRDPDRSGLQQGIRRVSQQLFAKYMAEKDYYAARQTVLWAAGKFGEAQLGGVLADWEKQLAELASKQMELAKGHARAGRLREAYIASREMMRIWPKLPEGVTLATSIAQRYPVVHVGVTRPAGRLDPRRFDDWASRRAGRLRQRTLVELNGYGTEGGTYISPFGSLTRSEDGLQLTIQVRRDLQAAGGLGLSGYDVARELLAISNPESPEYAPLWREILGNIHVDQVFAVKTDLRQFFLRPEAFLQIPLTAVDDEQSVSAAQPYSVVAGDLQEQRFVLNETCTLVRPTQPHEIVERTYSSSNGAIQALDRGDIDVIDRVYPGDIQRIRVMAESGVVVDSYAVPSLHMLVPNFDRPYTGMRVFRRAIVYGISRETILREDLLGGEELPGCRVISAPLPPGRSTDDALAYAYDVRVSPRPFVPRLAATLSAVSKSQLEKAAEKAGKDPPPAPELILVYPDAEITRIACTGISQYLSAVGIPCQAQPLPPGQLWPDEDSQWDLLYLDVVMAEPVVDVGRLLGAAGVIKGGSAYLEAALRRLVTAANWAEARRHLHRIHRLANEEVAVIPLWQLVDHFAYRPALRGVAPQPISLYQNVEDWQIDVGMLMTE